tara:strand:- start:6048 stop:6671 length:624 start_codon:yes stop_codon:yes gene_type:complete
MKQKMTIINFFWKAYKKVRPFNNYEARLEVPIELLNGIKTNPLEVLERILRYGLEQKVFGKGCYIAGVYQVQTSLGIFSRKDGKEVRLIDWNKGCSEKLVKFETYEEAFEEFEESEQPIEKKPSLMPSKIVEQIPYCLESKLEELSVDDGMETWKDYPAEFPVSEAEYMLSTYYEDGHVNCWALEEKEPDAKQEVRELKAFIKKFKK